MISFIDVDKSIFVWINTYWSNPVFDLIMPWISRLADAALICLWIVFLGLLKYRRPGPQTASRDHKNRRLFLFIYCPDIRRQRRSIQKSKTCIPSFKTLYRTDCNTAGITDHRIGPK